MRRLVVCLDGTWNLKASTTNIWRIYTLLADQDGDVAQLKYYTQGVGTHWYDSVIGGALGTGTYDNVKGAYTWITENYQPGDELFLFGFSRGALTALSLANLIDRCGIMKPETLITFEDVYRLYKMPGFTRTTPASVRFRQLSADFQQEKTLRFIGLFDSVAGLYAKPLSRESMHVMTFPESAVDVFHAIAIDENRRLFQSLEFQDVPVSGRLHERWFTGAHANVGGGYSFDPLSLVPLRWMLACARSSAGLLFTPIRPVPLDESLYTREVDSLHDFAWGIPVFCPVLFRKRRAIGRKCSGQAEEWIDSSVVSRYLKFCSYEQSSFALKRYFDMTDSRPTTAGDIHVAKP